MTLTINDTARTSDQTAHTARLAPGHQHLWEVSWLPGRALDRNSAITATILADHAGEGDLNERHRLWPFIENWAAELSLTGSDAINRAARPRGGTMTTQPRQHHDPKPGSAGQYRSAPDPMPPGDSAAAADRPGQDPQGGRLAYSVDEAARLTGLSRDLLYDEMRRGNLAYVKLGRWRLITASTCSNSSASPPSPATR